MFSTTLPTSRLAVAAGVLFAVTAGIDIPHHQSDPFDGALDYVLEAAFSASLALAAAGSWTLLRSAASRPAKAGWSLTAAGFGMLTVVTAATALTGGDVLGPVFGLALLAIAVGSVTLCVADALRRVEPRGSGVVMLVGLVAMVALGDGYGLLAWSAAWFAVAALGRENGGVQLPRTSRADTRASSAS
jgi:hypothetical protein